MAGENQQWVYTYQFNPAYFIRNAANILSLSRKIWKINFAGN